MNKLIPVFDTWEEMLAELRSIMVDVANNDIYRSDDEIVAEAAIRITNIITVYHNQRLLRGLDSKE